MASVARGVMAALRAAPRAFRVAVGAGSRRGGGGGTEGRRAAGSRPGIIRRAISAGRSLFNAARNFNADRAADRIEAGIGRAFRGAVGRMRR